jgi:CopG family transcriptional regulator, nickel-responsive regulator
MSEEVERFGASIERGLLSRFDAHLERQGYNSRSAAIADLMRDTLSQAVTAEDPRHPAIGSLTLFYNHGRKDLADRLSALGHEHHEIILTTLHFHLDADRCMEVVALKGTVGELRHFADHVQAMRGVLQSKLVLTADEGGAALPGSRVKHSHSHSHS